MQPQNPRIRDVLIALKIAGDYKEHLGRLRLQKFIYLADIISLYWDLLASSARHKTYKNGPYDSDIQNAVDILAFRGFVTIKNSSFRQDGTITSSYSISKNGIKLFDSFLANTTLSKRVKLYETIAWHIDEIGWKNLKALVYAEPTYQFSKTNGWGYRLDFTSLLSNETLKILDGFKKMFKKRELSKEDFTSLYFKILEAKLYTDHGK